MHRTWPIALSVLVLSLGLVSCLKGPNFTPKPESVLFNRGSNALDRSQFDVAALDFQTLINTYPDSEYAATAKQILENDPHLDCQTLTHTHMFSPFLLCDEGTTTTNSIQ